MKLNLVLDVGNSQIKGGFFDEGKLVEAFSLSSHPLPKEELLKALSGKTIEKALVACVNAKPEELLMATLSELKIAPLFLDYAKLKLVLDVDEPEAVGQDRIAGAYGALMLFPLSDCIVVDIGTAITVDLVAKEGRYLGGMIYLGAHLCAKALAEYTDKLPLVAVKKIPSPLAKTTETHLQAGIYYGQLGAIERLIDELRATAPSPSSVKIIATGGATREEAFASDLKELVDIIHPHLTLVGLHEILTELTGKE
jgi:type III pantothenate kinase